tara:strand:+ start:300 stop:446 length:147 start_codon:yes stop_codon:yes gene_type:complete
MVSGFVIGFGFGGLRLLLTNEVQQKAVTPQFFAHPEAVKCAAALRNFR